MTAGQNVVGMVGGGLLVAMTWARRTWHPSGVPLPLRGESKVQAAAHLPRYLTAAGREAEG